MVDSVKRGNPISKSNKEHIEKCKHCGNDLNKKAVRKLPKKFLEDKWGIWGGVELPYIQIYKVACPNGKCKKTYSVKLRGSNWLYK